MRKAVLILLLTCPLAGCALPDWLVPRLWKPVSWSDRSRQGQQDRYDRQLSNGSIGAQNPIGSRNYIPGASSNPFVPTDTLR